METTTVKILRYSNGSVAKFDTEATDGFRAKHYIQKQNNGYVHVVRRFVPKTDAPMGVPGFVLVSDRVFFGKYRIAEIIDFYKAQTWRVIADVIEKLEDEK